MNFQKMLVGLLAAAALLGQAPKEPRVIGAAHMAYYVTDLNKARSFYVGLLGFQEAFTLENKDGLEAVAFIKINDRQYIQLYRQAPKNHGYLHNIAFQVENAERMRDYLAERGVRVPSKVQKNAAGNLAFEFTDPFGFHVQMVQYRPGSLTARADGKFMPNNRISTHIDHLGIFINDKEVAREFYGGILGFQSLGNKLSIGNGSDRFELGFGRKPPTAERFHVKNHICLSAPDVPKMAAMLMAKPAYKNFREIEVHELSSGKRVAEIYDPDGNRIEVMEPAKRKLASQKTPVATRPGKLTHLPPGRHALLERLTKQFGLTYDQELEVEPLLHAEESMTKPLLKYAALSQNERRTMMTTIKMAARRQIRTLLMPDQQKKMDQEMQRVRKPGRGKKRKAISAKVADLSSNVFAQEQALSNAITAYAALSADEKRQMLLEVKSALDRNSDFHLTPDQEKQLKAEIKQLSGNTR